jgi:hypothetical protein
MTNYKTALPLGGFATSEESSLPKTSRLAEQELFAPVSRCTSTYYIVNAAIFGCLKYSYVPPPFIILQFDP